jgi:N-methylhydantoinase A/oxoprolinase/acetone carboxylase beta subunit
MQPHGEDSFITVDMGGTSFDAAMVVGGRPAITTTGSVNRFALALPSMEITTIGAGGGSIAWIDDGLLRMGPQSAGAAPGPACYAKGGLEPTCSDDNLVLVYLSPDFFAGGSIALDSDAAHRAITTRVADPLGMDTLRAASACNDEREHGVGHPRDFRSEGMGSAPVPVDLRGWRGRRARGDDRARVGHTPHRRAARRLDFLRLGHAADRPQT